MGKIVVRLDDIHPRMNWPKFDQFRTALEAAGCRGMLSVIPDCQDQRICAGEPRPDFWEQIADMKARGWVVAQHGCTHVYDSTAPNYLCRQRRSEFAGHDYSTQYGRLARGAEVMDRHGIKADVFVAPAHTFDAITLAALKELDFKYISDGYGCWPYRDRGLTFVPQLMAGPHGNRWPGVFTTALHLNSMREHRIEAVVKDLSGRYVAGFYSAAAISEPPIAGPVARLAMSVLWQLHDRRHRKRPPAVSRTDK